MATFECNVLRISKVEDHPNADRLSILSILGYETISAKLDDGSHRYKAGDLVVYVPEWAVVPDYLLKQGYWDEAKGYGILGGSGRNRVKAIKLRGVVSQGITFPVENVVTDGHRYVSVQGEHQGFLIAEGDQDPEGIDVSEMLGIVKFEPAMTASWTRIIAGNVFYIGTENTISYDIENLQKAPHVLDDPDEIVVVTEKLHGTNCQLAYLPGHTEHEGYAGLPLFVGSKGQSAKGLMFKIDEKSFDNVYLNTVARSGIAERFMAACTFFDLFTDTKMYLIGEVIGEGVQDLGYGEKEPTFRAFNIYRGNPRNGGGRWLDRDEFELITGHANIPTVPVLARGRWGDIKEKLEALRDGKTTLGGGHIREGVVVTPAVERDKHRFGRVILKAVSPAYLLRKGT